MRTTYRPPAPGEFQEMVKEESSLPWEARALDGLELPSFDAECFGLSGTDLLLEMLKIIS
jgi:hypothetical protein